jgi:hypothetical protein
MYVGTTDGAVWMTKNGTDWQPLFYSPEKKEEAKTEEDEDKKTKPAEEKSTDTKAAESKPAEKKTG